MANRSTRRVAVLLSGLLLLVALALAAAPQPATELSPFGVSRVLARDAEASPDWRRLAQAALTFRGGQITTSSGEVVDVRVSDSLPVETATPEGWAEFLTGLTHGPELARLTTLVVSFEEVQQICGPRAAGCYGPNRMVVPGEAAFDVTPEEVVRHEYGHHVAYHRLNPPWAAVDWGPKRWASTSNVCGKVSRREAFPGDQGSNYSRNPGEAWAETYRLMDERKDGILSATWPIVVPSFFPAEPALQAAESDVIRPWTAPRTVAHTRTFGADTPKVWWIPLTTSLDGDIRVSATLPAKGSSEVALVAPNRRTVLRRAQWVGQRVRRLDASICGQRSLFVRVTLTGATGRVRVSVTTP